MWIKCGLDIALVRKLRTKPGAQTSMLGRLSSSWLPCFLGRSPCGKTEDNPRKAQNLQGDFSVTSVFLCKCSGYKIFTPLAIASNCYSGISPSRDFSQGQRADGS
jgi:hypothetical protein